MFSILNHIVQVRHASVMSRGRQEEILKTFMALSIFESVGSILQTVDTEGMYVLRNNDIIFLQLRPVFNHEKMSGSRRATTSNLLITLPES